MTRRALWLALVIIMAGCSGNPFKSLSILSVSINPTELPPEGGQVEIVVDATRGDEATARVTRYGDWLWFVSYTVRLAEVIALDFEKKRWKGTIDFPPNHTSRDQRYIIVVTVRDDYKQDQRMKEVLVKARKND